MKDEAEPEQESRSGSAFLMSITIHDIAKLAGLHSSTVSRALRNDSKVKESTRERIHRIARDHGYIPNLSARNLADGRTSRIAFLMNTLYNGIEIEPATEANRLLSERGYSLMLLLCSGSKEIFKTHLDHLAQKLCDAVLIIPGFGENDRDILEKLKALKCPVIFIDRWPENTEYPAVTTDHANAMKQLFRCAEKEKMDSAFLDMAASNSASRNRFNAIREELERHRIPFIQELAELPKFLRERDRKSLCVFSNGIRPGSFFDAVFQEGKAKRPAKFFTCGFDCIGRDVTVYYDKTYLCIQNFKEIARISSEMVLNLLEGKQPPERIVKVPPLKVISC